MYSRWPKAPRQLVGIASKTPMPVLVLPSTSVNTCMMHAWGYNNGSRDAAIWSTCTKRGLSYSWRSLFGGKSQKSVSDEPAFTGWPRKIIRACTYRLLCRASSHLVSLWQAWPPRCTQHCCPWQACPAQYYAAGRRRHTPAVKIIVVVGTSRRLTLVSTRRPATWPPVAWRA